MRIGFFSPLPPARSGIADYSAALLEPLKRLAEVETFAEKPAAFDASRYQALIYQLGNNPHHTFVYEMALAHSGIVVIHEANLHHLIADLTIRRSDWEGYLREVELNGGPEAVAYARRYVVTLERGPDYEIPMLRTLLARSRAAIVHSGTVETELRAQGFTGPIAQIPHGAWLVDADRMAYRTRLGLDARTPLIGIFGFLKPYKRIAESLRAFRRLVRLIPEARLILVGEVHPELPLNSMITSLGLSAQVRHFPFAPIEDFNGYMASCDIVLNLRYPTVGENSGTLLRAMGMGKAVVVSDVGSFREYPDSICLKAPVDRSEEDHLYEYLNLLVSRPDLARELGRRAQEWVTHECNWETVAKAYANFAESVSIGREWKSARVASAVVAGDDSDQAHGEQVMAVALAEAVSGSSDSGLSSAPSMQVANGGGDDSSSGEYLTGWAPVEDGSRGYVESHLTRLEKTLAITPRGNSSDAVLEMGAYLQITPALKTRLGYGEVRGCYFGPLGEVHKRAVASDSGEQFECEIDLFDAERDRFPYPDERFATVLCCELLEHLVADPMHMMAEIHRILKPGGHLVLTTPNIVSLRAMAGLLQGFHPSLFPAYIRPRPDGAEDARHNREYTPREIKALLENSGFEVTLLDTGPFRDEPKPEHGWLEHLLDRYYLSKEHRGDGIYVVGRKSGSVKERYPAWLYS